MAEIRIVLNIFISKYVYSTENKKVYFIFKEYFLLFNNSTITEIETVSCSFITYHLMPREVLIRSKIIHQPLKSF